jgi:hypothetical protein
METRGALPPRAAACEDYYAKSDGDWKRASAGRSDANYEPEA